MCSIKKAVRKNLQYSQENTCVGIFLNSLENTCAVVSQLEASSIPLKSSENLQISDNLKGEQKRSATSLKKTRKLVFSFEFCKIFMNIFVMEQSRWLLLKNKNILINMRKTMSRESFIEAETNKFLTRFLFPHRTNTLERKIMFGIYLIQFTNIKLPSVCLTTFFILFYHARKY